MKIIVNSDVLATTYLIRERLPRHLSDAFAAAAKAGATIVIPTATMLEFQHRQEQLAEKERAALLDAATKLDQYKVSRDSFDASELTKTRDLEELVKRAGIGVEIVQPDIADYQGAEKRAARHESPLPEKVNEDDSDEMRDLVIWEVALRIAKAEGKAVLLSRDHVHSGTRGESEAQASNLMRAKDVDELLGVLGLESPSGEYARKLLASAWSAIREEGTLKLGDKFEMVGVSDASFEADSAGYLSGSFKFMVKVDNSTIAARTTIRQLGDSIHASLADIRVNGKARGKQVIEVRSDGHLPRITSPADEGLKELRNLLEGS